MPGRGQARIVIRNGIVPRRARVRLSSWRAAHQRGGAAGPQGRGAAGRLGRRRRRPARRGGHDRRAPTSPSARCSGWWASRAAAADRLGPARRVPRAGRAPRHARAHRAARPRRRARRAARGRDLRVRSPPRRARLRGRGARGRRRRLRRRRPRAVLAYGARGAGGPDEVRASAAFAGRHAADARLRGAIGIAGLFDTSDETLAAAGALASRAGVHACLGEDESDLAHAFARFGRRPIEVLAAHDLLGPRAVIAHGGTTVHAEAVLLADAAAALAVTPRAAMFFGAALPPLLDFASVGVPIAFGTDGLFPDVAGEALHAATMIRHAQRSASAAGGLVGRVAWPAAARLASEWFGEPLGRIEAGALADVVVLDWRPAVPPRTSPRATSPSFGRRQRRGSSWTARCGSAKVACSAATRRRSPPMRARPQGAARARRSASPPGHRPPERPPAACAAGCLSRRMRARKGAIGSRRARAPPPPARPSPRSLTRSASRSRSSRRRSRRCSPARLRGRVRALHPGDRLRRLPRRARAGLLSLALSTALSRLVLPARSARSLEPAERRVLAVFLVIGAVLCWVASPPRRLHRAGGARAPLRVTRLRDPSDGLDRRRDGRADS